VGVGLGDMEKAILSVFVGILLVPQLAFAAWWNPFSWKVFNREESKTQVLENRVKELEKKLEANVSTSTKVDKIEKTDATITKNKKIETKQEVKKEIKTFTTPNGAVIDDAGDVVLEPLVDQTQKKVISNIDNVATAHQYFDMKKTCVGLSGDQYSECVSYAYNQPPVKVNYTTVTTPSAQTLLDIEKARLDNEIAKQQILLDQANNKKIQLNAVNQKIVALNAKYIQDIKNVDIDNAGRGVTTASSNLQKSAIERKYISDYNTLQVEYQQILYSN